MALFLKLVSLDPEKSFQNQEAITPEPVPKFQSGTMNRDDLMKAAVVEGIGESFRRLMRCRQKDIIYYN
jgi:hypothetical protein